MKGVIFAGLLVTLFASVTLALPQRLRSPLQIKSGIRGQKQNAPADDFERIVAAYKDAYIKIGDICEEGRQAFEVLVLDMDTEIVYELKGIYGGSFYNVLNAVWAAEDDFMDSHDPQIAAYVIDIIWNYIVGPITTETSRRVEEVIWNKVPDAYETAHEINQKAKEKALVVVEETMKVIRPFLPEHYKSKPVFK